MAFYENLKEACARKGTNITSVLRALGKASGNTGAWKNGKSPSISVVIEIADYLGVSVDELAYGRERARENAVKLIAGSSSLTQEQVEWLYVFSLIPKEKRPACIEFLQTMAEKPGKKDSRPA